MKTFKQLNELQLVHKHIKDGNSGTPSEFAKKMYISQRHLYKILNDLKDMGAEINYDKLRQNYYYTNSFDLMVNLSVKVLKDGELKTIYGGVLYKNVKILDTARLAHRYAPILQLSITKIAQY